MLYGFQWLSQGLVLVEYRSHNLYISGSECRYLRIYWKPYLSPNPLLMYSANVKDTENADRWLAALSFFIVH